MDLANLSSYKENLQEFQEKDTQKISASDQVLNMKSDSFAMDMEPFSHLTNKDLSFTSRINLQKSLSTKGSQTGVEKMNSICVTNGGDIIDAIPSPKASSMAATMPEKLVLVNQTNDHITNPQVHHEITIMTGCTTTTTKPAGTPKKSNLFGKRSSKQSSLINPRRILFFFATLSSVGTILLICLTLSMAKYTEDGNSTRN